MKDKPSQKEVVRRMLINSQTVTGSTAYKMTKKQNGVGTLNLHKLLALLRKEGYQINDTWQGEGQNQFKEFTLNFKRTPKKLLQITD
jgi:uncharacterized protein YukE